jgi:hypothetical protein
MASRGSGKSGRALPPARAAARPSGPPGPEEARLLRLARDLAALARGGRPPHEALGEALARLSYVDPGREARSARGPAPGGEKARALALAWAREQVRLALSDLLERAAKMGAVRGDVPTDTLAWLALAACEALVHEPAEAVSDRLAALIAFIRPAARPQ